MKPRMTRMSADKVAILILSAFIRVIRGQILSLVAATPRWVSTEQLEISVVPLGLKRVYRLFTQRSIAGLFSDVPLGQEIYDIDADRKMWVNLRARVGGSYLSSLRRRKGATSKAPAWGHAPPQLRFARRWCIVGSRASRQCVPKQSFGTSLARVLKLVISDG